MQDIDYSTMPEWARPITPWDVTINEVGLEKFRAKKRKEQEILKKHIKKETGFFNEIIQNFNEWKRWIFTPNNQLKSIKSKYFDGRPYSQYNSSDGRNYSKWEIYYKFTKNPTVQGFVEYNKFIINHPDQVEIPLYISPNIDPKNPPPYPAIW